MSSKNKFEILHLYYRYPLYSGGCYFTEFLESLSKEGYSSILLSDRFPLDSKIPKTGGIKVVWTNSSATKPGNEFMYIFGLFRFLFDKRLKDVSIVNCVGPRGLLFANFFALFHRVPVICTIEMLTPPGKSLYSKVSFWVSRLLLTYLPKDKIICWSQYHADNFLYTWGLQSKTVVIPPGIDTSVSLDKARCVQIREKYASGLDMFLTFVKPLYEPSGDAALIILEALKILHAHYNLKSKIMLFFRGESQEEKVLTFIEKNHLQDFVIKSAFVDFADVSYYVAASDFFILPYKYIPTVSRSVLEALLAAVPTITTPTGEIKNIVKDGINGFFFDGTSKDLARLLYSITQMDPAFVASIAKAGRTTITANFSQQVVASKYVRLFEQLLS